MWYKRGIFKKAYKTGAKRYSKGGKFSSTKLARDVGYLKSLVNSERKFIDTSLTTAIGTSPILHLLNGVASGDDSTNRDGNSIKISSVMIEGFVSLHASATNDYIRMALIQDMQGNGNAATYTEIYESSSPVAMRNKQTVDRFKVLKEYRVTLATGGDTIYKYKCWYKFGNGKDAHTKYNGNGATIASLYTNALYWVVLGVQATNTTSQVTTTRIRFIDN